MAYAFRIRREGKEREYGGDPHKLKQAIEKNQSKDCKELQPPIGKG